MFTQKHISKVEIGDTVKHKATGVFRTVSMTNCGECVFRFSDDPLNLRSADLATTNLHRWDEYEHAEKPEEPAPVMPEEPAVTPAPAKSIAPVKASA